MVISFNESEKYDFLAFLPFSKIIEENIFEAF